MDALALSAKMVNQGVGLEEYMFSIVLKACAGLEQLNFWETNSCSWSGLNAGYCQMGEFEDTSGFIVGEKNHPKTEDFYSKLEALSDSVIKEEPDLLTEAVSDSFPERKEQPLFRNLRACETAMILVNKCRRSQDVKSSLEILQIPSLQVRGMFLQ
ncbi:hypothetical protein OIU84_003758 [Salix udensis]|uniref:Uncharacterized protein n=1 Tax=Salix udensis TaxID=889485 RepID=A0AAD6K0P2_9ROSI|nr:hypothetical protein OIU84_003758 [Salix udensis]